MELPHAMLGSVLSQYENRRSGFFLAMYHTGEEERSRIHLGFSEGDRHAIVLDCSTGRRLSPWHRAAIDFSWYLQHLLPDPELSNLTITAIKIDSHHT